MKKDEVKEAFKWMLFKSRGISVLFLIVAMLIMVIIGYLFSYLMPTKQKSIILSIYSTQAFFIAQSGVEFAIRYASDNDWITPSQLNNLNGTSRSLGRGQFTLSYDSLTDRLSSRGVIQNISERQIIVSNFTQFVNSSALIIDPDRPPPCETTGNIGKQTVTVVNFYIKNVSASNIILNAFQCSWEQNPPTRQIVQIYLNGNLRFDANYQNGNPPVLFISPYTINSGSTIIVSIYFSRPVNNLRSVVFTLYDNLGNNHNFNLDSQGEGLPNC